MMKKAIYYAAILSLLISCQDEKAIVNNGPDSATTVTGTYKLTYASYFSKDITSSYSMGSLVISKVNSVAVKGEVQLGYPADANYGHSTSQWDLREITKDSIILGTDGYYSHDKVFLSVVDASLHLRFVKQ